MRTLDRYLVREFLRLFALFAVAAPLLFILGDWTDNLDTFSNRGIPVGRVAIGYVYAFPQFMYWSLPVAALVATVFSISAMTRHSEMVAAKAGGISFFRVIFWLPILGILLTGLGLALVEVVPVALSKRAEVMGESGPRTTARSNFVYRAESGDVLAVTNLDARSGRMFNPVVEHEGDGVTTRAYQVLATEALYDPARGYWTFHEGFIRIFPPGSSADCAEADTLPEPVCPLPMRQYEFESLEMPRIGESPEQLLAQPKDAEEMRYAELGKFIHTLERSGAEPHELRVEQAQKLAIPAAALVVILFGAPLANSHGRAGPAYGIGISLAITIAYLMLFRVTQAVGATGLVSPMVAAWSPNGVMLLAGLVLMTRVRT